MSRITVGLLAAILLHASGAAAQMLDRDARWQRLSQDGVAAAAAGRIEEARSKLRLALDIARELDQNDPRRASAANNLGFTLLVGGEPADALPLFEDALRQREAATSPDALATASVLNNLAETLRQLGRPEDALRLARHALQIRSARLEPQDPALAQSLDNLAVLLTTTGKGDEAAPLYAQALAIRTRALGPEHPLVAEVLANQGALELTRQHLDAAEAAFRQAIAILDRAKAAPDVRSSALIGLAKVLVEAGRPGEAVPLLNRAYSLRADDLGAAAPETIAAQRLLGTTLVEAGETMQAVQALSDVLVARERTVGPRSTDLIPDLVDLAHARAAGDDLEAAMVLLGRAAQLAGALGDTPADPRLPTLLNELAFVHYKRGAPADADPLLEQAAAIETRAPGGAGQELGVTLRNRAVVLRALGRAKEADAVLERVRTLRRSAD